MTTTTVPTPVSAALTDLLDRARPASSLAAEQPLSAPTFPAWKGTTRDLSSRLGVAVAVVLALLVALVTPGLASGPTGSTAEHASGAAAASAEAHPALQSPTAETRVRASTAADQTRVGANSADLATLRPGSGVFYDRAASGWLVAPRAASGAESAAPGERLRTHLRLTQDYGAGGVRELADGRIRYYDVLDPARKPGTMAGRRLVREWDPATGRMRTWHETLDNQGRIRQVRPVDRTRHYTFDEAGNYTGYWPE